MWVIRGRGSKTPTMTEHSGPPAPSLAKLDLWKVRWQVTSGASPIRLRAPAQFRRCEIGQLAQCLGSGLREMSVYGNGGAP